ncbi:MAG: Ig-like domain-containing protein [Patescibacteria group bacterium]|nr:Ig-like domain-containing protein [Patescibacteria group bacterium]
MDENLNQQSVQPSSSGPTDLSTVRERKILRIHFFPFTNWTRHYRKSLLILTLGLIIILIGMVAYSQLPRKSQRVRIAAADVTLKPTLADTLGVDRTSAFILKSKNPLALEAVKSSFKVEPKTDYEIKEENSKEFRIIFPKALERNKIYKFELATTSEEATESVSLEKDLSWAFQVKNPFRVVQTLPRDKATSVALGVGIEITFSHDNYQDIDSFFEITPKVEGRFERHRRTVIFVPKHLQPDTLYTVKLKKGLGFEGSEEKLKEDYVFQFETESHREKYNFEFTREISEFPNTEKPAFSVYLYHEDAAPTLNVSAFQFPDQSAFLNSLKEKDKIPTWASVGRRSYLQDSFGLPPVLTFDAPVQKLQYSTYFVFPQTLKEGYYLVEVKIGDQKFQSWLQITDVASYLSTSNTKTLFWVNDVSTKKPVSGARIELIDGNLTQTTNDSGTAFFETPKELLDSDTRRYFKVTSPGGKTAVVPVAASDQYYYGYYSGYLNHKTNVSDQYWIYLYFDRPLYLPTDSVAFWGVVKDRDHPQEQKTLKLEVSKSGSYDYDYQPVITSEQEIRPTEMGTFSGEIPLKNLQPGCYETKIKLGEDILVSRSFEVQTYTKPAYKIDLETPKKAIFTEESVDFKGKTSFFEGTPVPKVNLKYTGAIKGEITSDEKGEFDIPYQPKYKESQTYYSSWDFLEVTPSLAEEGEIEGRVDVRVFGPRIALQTSAETSQDNGSVRISVKNVDLTRLNDGTAKDYLDYLSSPVANQSVTGKLYENHWEKKEVGDYYDFINKVVSKRYEYKSVKTFLKDVSVTTDDHGEGIYQFPVSADKYYQLELEAPDNGDRKAKSTVYLYGAQSSVDQDNDYYFLEGSKGKNSSNQYSVGEKVTLSFKKGDQMLPNGGDNRYLYSFAQRGIRDFKVQENSTYDYNFKDIDIPNIIVNGVYFNGETYFLVSDLSLPFKSDDKKLTIELKPDKSSYRPKETVTLGVSVHDKDGAGQKSEVNLSLVDESVFKLEEQSIDTLGSLYQSVSSGVIQSYVSHQYPRELQGGGGGGGGGGDGGRGLFMDRAFFGVVKTDSSGNGKISFKLPDNLTSWRITYQAVSGNLSAGSGTKLLPVKQPFFVDAVLNTNYLVGDKPIIKLRSFGEDLKSDQKVEFSVKASTLGVNEEQKLTAAAFETATLELPSLKEGEHKITFKGKGGDLEDTLVKTINVSKTNLMAERVGFDKLKPNLKIEGSKDLPTTLVFSDENRGKFYSLLRSFATTIGDRLDQRLARIKARQYLKEYFNEDWPSESFRPSDYQTTAMWGATWGGITLFPFGDVDYSLSAKVASAAKDFFDKKALAESFYKVLSNKDVNEEEAAVVLYGLSALNEPVLVPVESLLRRKDLSPLSKLYLGLASAQLGNKEKAREVYNQIVKDYGEALSPYLRIKVGKDQDDILQATALVADLASILDDERQDKLFWYLNNTQTKDVVVYLEGLIYLANGLPKTSGQPSGFTYILNGQKINKTLEKGGVFKLQVSPEDLAKIGFENISGKVGLTYYYDYPLDTTKVVKDENLFISREYSVDGRATTEFKETDLVKVTLNYGFEYPVTGCYQISDLLPAGLKFVGKPYSRGVETDDNWYPYEVTGQKVNFCVNEYYHNHPIVYYGRVVSKGDFKAEGATIRPPKDLGNLNITESKQVKIK